MKAKLIVIAALIVGVIIGGFLFSKSQRRSAFAVTECRETCYTLSDVLGLLASAGIQQAPGFIPSKVLETDTVVVVRHPQPEARIHYVILPKKDIRNIGEISPEDREYLIEMYAAAQTLIQRENLESYRLITNGPGFQQVTYLHFHLRSN